MVNCERLRFTIHPSPFTIQFAKLAATRRSTMKLEEIAARLRCELRGDGSIEIHGLAPIEEATAGTLTFVANPRYRSYLKTTRASAVIVAASDAEVPLPSLRA